MPAQVADQLQVRTVPYVLEKFQISSATLRRRIADGRFPAPFKVGGSRRLAWLERDLNSYLESQARTGREQPACAAPDAAEAGSLA
jgi:predicted DNA-binding transcriptional regulator AlpA